MKILNENYKLIEQNKNENTFDQQRNFSCSSLQNSQPYFNKKYTIVNNEDNSTFNQLMKTIKSYWNQLGVLEDYRALFIVVINQLDEGNKTDFLNNEIEALLNITELLTVRTVMYLFFVCLDFDSGCSR